MTRLAPVTTATASLFATFRTAADRPPWAVRPDGSRQGSGASFHEHLAVRLETRRTTLSTAKTTTRPR